MNSFFYVSVHFPQFIVVVEALFLFVHCTTIKSACYFFLVNFAVGTVPYGVGTYGMVWYGIQASS